MIDPRFWSVEHSAGSVLILGFVAFFVGASMYWIRGGLRGGAPPTHAYFVWERGFIMAAVVLTAIGFVLLEVSLQNTAGLVLARVGATAYLFGGVLWVVAEASSLTPGSENHYPLIVIYLVLAFLAQVAIGGALLQAGLLAAWIGWITIVWNGGWFVAVLITRLRAWFPFLHHLMPLVIGIALLSHTA